MSENEQNGLMDFKDRFKALLEEAEGYGVKGMVCLEISEPFEGTTQGAMARTVGPAHAIGMMSCWIHSFKVEWDQEVD